MAIKINGKIVSNKFKEADIKTQINKSIVNKSFSFIGPKETGYELYYGYIIKELGSKIFVWLLKPGTGEHRECTINKSIINLNVKNDYKNEREMFYSANIYRTGI